MSHEELQLSTQSGGRVKQKSRTRADIVRAARDLIAAGKAPTVAEAADAAGVSRATAYRYFSSQEALLADAALEPAAERIAEEVRRACDAPDMASRVDALVRAMHAHVSADEPSMRAMLKMSLDRWFAETRSGERPPLRGGRRMDYLRDVLAPLQDEMPKRDVARLARALSLTMGVEALVVMRDVWRVSDREALATLRWAAAAILGAALREAGENESRAAE